MRHAFVKQAAARLRRCQLIANTPDPNRTGVNWPPCTSASDQASRRSGQHQQGADPVDRPAAVAPRFRAGTRRPIIVDGNSGRSAPCTQNTDDQDTCCNQKGTERGTRDGGDSKHTGDLGPERGHAQTGCRCRRGSSRRSAVRRRRRDLAMARKQIKGTMAQAKPQRMEPVMNRPTCRGKTPSCGRTCRRGGRRSGCSPPGSTGRW
jgi:hypothetical protein